MPASPYLGHGPEHLSLWRECPDIPGFVYVIKGVGYPPIKVGYAKDVEARMATLQTGNPLKLELLHVVPGELSLEWHLHRQIKGGRLRGEWFDGPAVLSFLRYVADLADRMVAAYQATGRVPIYEDVERRRFERPRRRKQNPVTVRFVEPSPRVSREEAERMRQAVREAPGVYLEPQHPIARQKTPGRAKNGGYLGGGW